MSPTVGAAWRAVRDRFRAAALDTPELDARLLAERAFGLDRLTLTAREAAAADPAALAILDGLAARRLSGEPVARILGEKAFWGQVFRLAPETLVPRPETEMLVEAALTTRVPGRRARLLDLGTGTGCIPISLLADWPELTALAIDLSPGAAATARENAERIGVADRFEVRIGSWFSPVGAEEFDLITANPPYIETSALPGLMREVREYDPALALDGGPDGLGPYREIVPAAISHLCGGGWIFLEIGTGQGAAVAALCQREGFAQIRIARDLGGHERMVVAQKP